MTRLFIEEKELDLTASISQQITYAIDDIRNVDNKATTFSRTIVLPGTARNNNLFGQIFEFNHANFTNDSLPNVEYNFNASKSAKCRLESDGMLVMKGILRLLQIVNDGGRIEYEVSIFGELGGFIAKLGALKLQDLDFSEYDHVYTTENVEDSWDNDNAGAGYYYPHIDYGAYSAGSDKKDWNLGTFRPALFVKEYLEKIVANAGYSMDFALLNTDRFKRLIIPQNKKLLYNIDPVAFKVLITGVDSFSGNVPELLSFNAISIAGGFTASGGNTVFTYSGDTIIGELILSIIVTNYTNASAPPYEVKLLKNNISQGSGFLVAESFPKTIIIKADVTINTGDYISVQLKPPPSSLATLDISTTIFSVETQTTQPVPINYGETIKINGCIPQNILQKDFFISIIKLFNLYVYEDSMVEKKLVIKPYVDFYIDQTDDYSDRVDRSKPMVIKPMSELNSRYYQFKYKNDTDYWNELYRKRYNEGYGDRVFDSQYEFASETQTSEIIFAPTPLVGYADEDKKFSTIFKRNGNEPNITEERIDSVIRILQAKKIEDITSWRLFTADDTGVLGDFTKYAYAGHFNDPDNPTNDLNFGATKELFFTGESTGTNQFNVYYSPYMAEITDKDSRLLTCNINFNGLQIANLDFSRYIWIDGGLYRLMRVIDYTPGTTDSCKVELLRVINKTY